MTGWWVQTYGDPCRSCGFEWGLPVGDAVRLVREAPEHYRSLMGGTAGNTRHPDLGWSAKAYVFHVADNLSIWSELWPLR